MPLRETAEWTESFPGVWHQVLVDRALGAGAVTMGRVRIEPGSGIPPHSHTVEDAMVVLSGKAEFHVDGEVVELVPGSGMLVPANAVHWGGCIGEEPLELVFTWPSVDVERFPAMNEPSDDDST